jgi:predicted phage baseplate assembly protein
MPLPTPRLDDRTFDDLVEEARARIPLYTPEWTDHNLSDPGITLIELFAFMTDVALYRLNRVPDKHYVKFMELIGMKLHEAEAARVPVTFWLTAPQANDVIIPSGTEVATVRTETEQAIVFSTDGPLTIKVPQLDYLMSSTGREESRSFSRHNPENLASGLDSFLAFGSNPPENDDAFYLGFSEDLSNQILGINLEVDMAEGAGIDPNKPPYVWEVLATGLNPNWVRVDVDMDGTLGLNVSGLIRLHLPEMRLANRNDINAYWVRCRLASSDNNSRYNRSPRIRRLTVGGWGGTVGATNVTRVQEEVLGRSDGSPGQRFHLVHSPVLARLADEHLIVRREDASEERWQEVSDFANSQPNDRHYTIDSDSGEVRLAPALPQRDGTIRRYGALPPKGALILMKGYRYGGGTVGNVAAHTLIVLKTSIPFIGRVTNREAARGGLNAETLESAKARVPGHLRSLGRAVTASDFEYLAMQAAPGQIGRAYCLQPPLTNQGEINLLIVPRIPRLQGFISPESLELNEDLREAVRTFLDERRLLSTRLDVSAPAYQWVETEIRFRVAANFNPERVRQAIEDRLFAFLNPLIGGPDGQGWPIGRDLFVSDVLAVLQSVEGVSFVRSAKLFPITYERRQWTRSAESNEIRLPAHGVIVSYQHNVFAD